MITVEYQALNDLIDQVKLNTLVLGIAKKHSQDSGEIAEFDKVLESNALVIEKARETLKTIPRHPN